ncbi:MAG: tryptophan-rich sensory protein [bacterium]
MRLSLSKANEVFILAKQFKSLNIWYEQLNGPPVTPPDRIFFPVWLVLNAFHSPIHFFFCKIPDR